MTKIINSVPQFRWGLTWRRPKAMHYHENWAVEEETADFLYGFTRAIKPARVLEIGTFEGVSACAIGQALKKTQSGKLWTFDYKDYGQKEYIKSQGLEDYVECIIGENPTAILEVYEKEGKFDMSFVDDGHEFDLAFRDILVSDKVIRQYGYILGHDVIEIPSVTQALDTFLADHPNQYEKLIVSSYNGVFMLRKLV